MGERAVYSHSLISPTVTNLKHPPGDLRGAPHHSQYGHLSGPSEASAAISLALQSCNIHSIIDHESLCELGLGPPSAEGVGCAYSRTHTHQHGDHNACDGSGAE